MNITDEQIINKYKEMSSIYAVGKFFKIKPHAAWRILSRNKIKMDAGFSSRKYKKDIRIFERIDSEERAYWLGFLYADGCVHKNILSFCLAKKDGDMVRKFSNFIIGKDDSRIGGVKEFPQRTMRIFNEALILDLKDKGMGERKSLTLELPTFNKVPEDVFHHFVRGYFDGDGSIHKKRDKNNKKAFGFNICASYAFSKELIERLKKYDIQLRETPQGKIARVMTSSKIEMRKFHDYIYRDATILLERKKKVFESLIKVTDWNKFDNPKYSKVVGVTFDKRRGHWYAVAKQNGEQKWLGSYRTEAEAICARKNHDSIFRNRQ